MGGGEVTLASKSGPTQQEGLYGAMATAAFPPIGPLVLIKWLFFSSTEETAQDLATKAQSNPDARPEEKSPDFWTRILNHIEATFGGILAAVKWIIIIVLATCTVWFFIRYILPLFKK